MMESVGIIRPGFPAAVVATYGAESSTTPLVVLLHGRGSHERDIITLAPHLPHGPAYAALRGPVPDGGGFAWFANYGIGRPVPESLTNTMSWFRAWLASVAPPRRRVFLIGFSGGAAFAGGLMLDRPRTFSGGALLCGTLPFEAGVPIEPDRLRGEQIFLAHGEQDGVIPADLLDRTWSYLVDESGADVTAWRDPAAHEITSEMTEKLSAWLTEQLHRRQ
jgi:phospholipase/carboxylesterase